jgi:hypothetical protein
MQKRYLLSFTVPQQIDTFRRKLNHVSTLLEVLMRSLQAFSPRLPSCFLARVIGATLLAPSAASAVVLSAPTINLPSNGQARWLFNIGTSGARDSFKWNAVSGATAYQFVLSKQSTFANYSDSTASCVASGCHAFSNTTTSAGAAKFGGFVFENATYYWKVRAVSGTSRGPWSVPRSFSPAERPNVVAQSLAYSVSPQSRVDRTDGGTVTWLTELDTTLNDNVDGKLLMSAYTMYGSAPLPRELGTVSSPTRLRTDMDKALTRTGGWAAAERAMLIDRIKVKYVAASLTRNGLLATLAIRSQCKEFADRMVIAGGGTPRTYGAMGAAKLDVRPGMYVVWNTRDHAAIANAVYFDASGNVFAQLSESNWGNAWGSNPKGQVPWSRVVTHTRRIQVTTTGPYRAHLN